MVAQENVMNKATTLARVCHVEREQERNFSAE
jgi:hypothetical protein